MIDDEFWKNVSKTGVSKFFIPELFFRQNNEWNADIFKF